MSDSVYLKALTPEARSAIGGPYYQIVRFPFRVGRECRLGFWATNSDDARRKPNSIPNNDLYIFEPGTVFNVSREHFTIDIRGGAYVLMDRGSSCGTLVEGDHVGEKKKGGWRRLEDNDVIIVGSSESRYIFKFVVVRHS